MVKRAIVALLYRGLWVRFATCIKWRYAMLRGKKIAIFVGLFLCIFAAATVCSAEDITVRVENVDYRTDGSVEVNLSWTPGTVTIDFLRNWQGILYPPFTVDPKEVYLLENGPDGQTETLLGAGRITSTTFTRDNVENVEYGIRYTANVPLTGELHTAQSNYVTISSGAPHDAPTLFTLPRDPVGDFTLQWSNVGAVIHEVATTDGTLFNGGPLSFPTGTFETITTISADTATFHVRGWTDLPENGGEPGAWSNEIAVTHLGSDEAFLNHVSRATFDYFCMQRMPMV